VIARPVGTRFDHGERRYPLGMADNHQPEGHGGSQSSRPMKQNWLPFAVAVHRIVETCVSFDRFFPRKSDSVLRPPMVGGSSDPSRGLKLFNEAHASISVPSTVKWSLDRSFFTRG
jgi:hypothetical protein